MIKVDLYLDGMRIGTIEELSGSLSYNQNCGTCCSKSPLACKKCNNFSENIRKCLMGRVRELHKEYNGPILAEKKEEPTMKVSYNGFTGELVKLEQHRAGFANEIVLYDLSIYDGEKQVTHSFTGVKLEDVKFLGGEVSFK